MKITAQTVNITLNAIVIVGLLLCIILAGVVMKEQHETALLLANTKELAQELRQSSDDLTRFIRTYTVTGNESYWGYFLQVIAIRDGKAPLPEQPWRNYWDLFISDGKAPRGFLAPSALLSRMEDAKFDSVELALLVEAKRQSDALIDLEDTAYNAMNGRYRPVGQYSGDFSMNGTKNQTLAMQLVHSTQYHIWKGWIMRPLDEFAAHANDRVLASINYNFKLNVILIAVLSVMLAALIGLLLFYFLKVAKDTQTAQLLGSMLPERVVATVTVDAFQQLKDQAKIHAKKLRTLAGREHAVGSTESVGFPVLYSEFLPLAWVAFTDVVQFTAMCRYTNSRKVVSVLNELFSLLDVEAQYYQVEKIKTIGDAFMCAKLSTSELEPDGGGAKNNKVARDGQTIVRFLLRAMTIAQGVSRPFNPNPQQLDDGPSPTGEEEIDYGDLPYLTLRVGLHVGPVASGIVGFERPLYDLFGDTVNTAARLEANGRPDRVHVMESSIPYFVQDGAMSGLDFEVGTHEVEMKGIGKANTRFIRGWNHGSQTSSRPGTSSSHHTSHHYHVSKELSPTRIVID